MLVFLITEANSLPSTSLESSAGQERAGLTERASVEQAAGPTWRETFPFLFPFERFLFWGWEGGVTSLCLQCHNCTMRTQCPLSYFTGFDIFFTPLSVCPMTSNCQLAVFLCLRFLFFWNHGWRIRVSTCVPTLPLQPSHNDSQGLIYKYLNSFASWWDYSKACALPIPRASL